MRVRVERRIGVGGVVAALVAGLAVWAPVGMAVATGLPSNCAPSASGVTCTYGSTGAEQSFAVPSGVTQLQVTAIGGRGANGGGLAAQVSGTISVPGLYAVYVEVGQAGDEYQGFSGFNGGVMGGGDASDVRTVPDFLSTRLIVAGGGGGGTGGAPGGDAGAAGGPSSASTTVGQGGQGASPSGGGAGGAGATGDASTVSGLSGQGGTRGIGGAGSTTFSAGAGGGGGLYGGGGGGGGGFSLSSGDTGQGGGGGGGSSLVPEGGTSSLTGSPASVTITYSTASISGTPPNGAVGVAYAFGFTVDGQPTPSVSADPAALPPGLTLSSTGVLSGTPTTSGDYSFTVTASNGYAPDAHQLASIHIDPKTAQTVGFTSAAPTDAVAGSSGYVPSASSSANLPVSITVDASSAAVCSISGGVVSYLGAGTCVLDANQPGNANVAPASQVQQSFPVGAPSAQVITFTSTPPAHPQKNDTYTVSATGGGSNNPVTFQATVADAGICTVADNGNSTALVTFTGFGTCVIAAKQAGSAAYAKAKLARQQVRVLGTQAIMFTSTPPAHATPGTGYVATANGGASGAPVVFSAPGSDAGICTVAADGTVSFVGSGTCVINARQAGSVAYRPAPQRQQRVKVFTS